MYDRKTWIVLIACGILLALNFHYSGKNQQERIAYERQQRELREQREAESAAAAAAVDPLTGEAAEEGVEGGELRVERPPAPVEESLHILQNEQVTYTLTNIGGGIKHAEFRNERNVGSEDTFVRQNRFGPGPIGALAGVGEILENVPHTYREEESVEGRKAVFIAPLRSGLIVKKTFELTEPGQPGADFLLRYSLTVENSTQAPMSLSQWSVFLGEASPLYQKEWSNQTGLFWREDNSMHYTHAGKFSGGFFSSAKPILTSRPGHVIEYAGVTNQFFATALRPAEPQATLLWAKPAQVTLEEGAAPLTSVHAGLRLPEMVLNPGERHDFEYELFIGPRRNQMLRQMGDGWGDLMQYGWFWWVARPLNWLLNNLHSIFDHVASKWSWGLAIIFLTIIVRTLIWPLHAKSTRTMKRMSKLQPEMAKLREKYADDPNKLNQEMMGLYRKFQINPLGGCLPMLIQLPIFFGFYRMLQYAVELRHQEFLWVGDLSQPDTLTYVAGIPINILPIVMAFTSFLQIKMMPKTGDKLQQRIILFMPLIFFFFCYNFASALALYWTTQNIFSIGQTWLMNRMPEPELKARKDAGRKSWVERMAEKQAELQRLQQERARSGGGGGMRDVTPSGDKKKRPPRTGG